MSDKTDWKIPLYGSDRYHLWSKPSSDIRSNHHHHSGEDLDAHCQSNPDFCYENVKIMSHVTTLRCAHRIIEYGFYGLSSKRISICNDPSENSDSAWNLNSSPFFFADEENPDIAGGKLGRHPLSGEKVLWFDIEKNSSDEEEKNSPTFARGNIAFNLQFPCSLLLRGKLNLYLIEFAEFGQKICARYLMTRRNFDSWMSRIRIDDFGGPMFFDGQRLKVLRKMKKINGQVLPLMHEITMDESMFLFLDQKCFITHQFPKSGSNADEEKKLDKIFGKSDEKSDNDTQLEETLAMYGKLLNLYQNSILKDVLQISIPLADPEMELSRSDIRVLSGFKITVEKDFFDLTRDLYAAPKRIEGLKRNCIKIYQALYCQT